MATAEENVFSSYEFSHDEYILAATYSELQRQHLQNQLSMYAQQKLAISAEDYPQMEVFLRNHEYHRGLMDAMRFLLELDSSLKANVIEKIQEAEMRQHREDQHREEGGFQQ